MIQVYTGNGKGKTTSALGLAIRAAGAGHNVYIAQFCKGRLYNEIKTLKKIKKIKLEQFGRRCFIKKEPEKIDKQLAENGFAKSSKMVLGKKFKVVILDEINIALKYRLISRSRLIELIEKTPTEKELILTGRYAHPEIIKRADLVSRIKEVKHYYNCGKQARKGIEF